MNTMTLNEVIVKQMEKVSQTYGINPLFAGLFGSEAKGYSGPDSDIDLYVPYVGDISQYVKALDIDTTQIEGELRLPPQETVVFTDTLGKEHSVQFNYESFDHYVQELTRSNLDFRLALDNILWKKPESDQLIDLLHDIAATYFDPERVKHSTLSRTSKALNQLKKLEVINPSEITDGFYRLFYAINLVEGDCLSIANHNHTHTYQRLLSSYLSNHPDDQEVKTLGEAIRADIADGLWRGHYVKHAQSLISVMERLIPEYKVRLAQSISSTDKSQPINRTIVGRFILASEINNAFIQLLMKGVYRQ